MTDRITVACAAAVARATSCCTAAVFIVKGRITVATCRIGLRTLTARWIFLILYSGLGDVPPQKMVLPEPT